jgi:hypothetical protein
MSTPSTGHGEIRRFSVRGAVLGLFVVLVIEALFMFSYGAKECGELIWGFFFFGLLPLMWIKAPWTALAIPIGFLIGGVAYRFVRYRKMALLIAVILAIASVLIGVAYAPTVRVCHPI